MSKTCQNNRCSDSDSTLCQQLVLHSRSWYHCRLSSDKGEVVPDFGSSASEKAYSRWNPIGPIGQFHFYLTLSPPTRPCRKKKIKLLRASGSVFRKMYSIRVFSSANASSPVYLSSSKASEHRHAIEWIVIDSIMTCIFADWVSGSYWKMQESSAGVVRIELYACFQRDLLTAVPVRSCLSALPEI